LLNLPGFALFIIFASACILDAPLATDSPGFSKLRWAGVSVVLLDVAATLSPVTVSPTAVVRLPHAIGSSAP
jgi:hypothetical protein